MENVVPEIPAAPVEPAVPAAPAAPEAPAAAPAAPAESLIPEAPPAATPEAPAPVVAPVETPAEPKWYMADGVPGEGEAPDFLKTDKYANLFEQAKAYPELESRFGAFTGAPKDGVYALNTPSDIPIQFDLEHPLFQELNGWAKESQLSQKAYDDVIGMFSRYEASVQPDLGEVKKQLGDNADARITAASQWAKSNLTDAEYQSFRAAQTESNAAEVFKAFEAVIAKTRQVSLPKPGEDVPGVAAGGLEAIDKLQAALDDQGRRKFEHDSEYRAMVEQKRMDFFKAQER